LPWAFLNLCCCELAGEHPGTQQFHPGSAVHGSLQGFEPVDLPFGLSITPEFRDGVSDGGEVLPQLENELAHTMDA
jgi:hypothetical protein